MGAHLLEIAGQIGEQQTQFKNLVTSLIVETTNGRSC